MYRMSSTGCLVVSADKVVTAIAFQSVMTAGSPAGAADVVAAVAVPAVRVIRSGTAAQKASHLRAWAAPRGEDRRWLDVCILPPGSGWVTVVEGDDSRCLLAPLARSHGRLQLRFRRDCGKGKRLQARR